MNAFFKQQSICISWLLAAWICGGLLYALPNHGGAGLNLPQNLMTWAIMAIIALVCVITQPLNKPIRISADSAMLVAGALCWSLPLLWSPEPGWRLNALPKVAALWGILGFYFVLLSYTSGPRLRLCWLTILTVAAVSQATYAVFQLKDLAILPGGRPYGSFQQVNVLASFLATGLACALWLFLQHQRRILSIVYGLTLFILPAVLMILQSRAGLLGASISSLVLLFVVRRDNSKLGKLALIIMFSGCGSGVLFLHAGHYLFPDLQLPLVDKESSNNSRLAMLKLTWQMILQHPFIGNGYGSFEALYGQLAQWIPSGIEKNTVQYPHNELLYAWAEGGLIAVVGLLLMVTGIARRLWLRDGLRYQGVAFLLPIAIHMNLEYPLYQSASHGLTLIMLVVVCGGMTPGTREYEVLSVRLFQRILIGFSALAVLFFMLTGLQTQSRLTTIEQKGLIPLAFDEQTETDAMMNVYSQFDRLDFDRHVALLLRFNQTQNPRLLETFRHWAQAWLEVHNDPSVYFSLLMIAHARHSSEESALCQKAHRMWVSDNRFQCHIE